MFAIDRKLKSVLFLGIVFIGILFAFYPVLQKDLIFRYDDQSLIYPVKNLHSFGEYITNVKNGNIFDLQPVRDFSYWIDWRINDAFGYGSFHFTNLILWFCLCFIFWRLLGSLYPNSTWNEVLVILMAFDPIFSNTVGWVSARKHILSAIFILLSTLYLVKKNDAADGGEFKFRHAFVILLFYNLAIYSQPIGILWPVWCALFFFTEYQCWPFTKKNFPKIALLFLLFFSAIICAQLNESYYHGTYLKQTNGLPKIVSSEAGPMGIRLLALGRYFFQILLPFWPSPSDHYPGNPQNFLGLILIPIALLSIRKWVNHQSVWLWIFFGLLPIVIVTVRLTNIFASDTYLILPFIGVLTGTGSILNRRPQIFESLRFYRFFKFIVATGIFSFFLLFVAQGRVWQSELEMWKSAYQVDPTPTNTAYLGLELLAVGRSSEAMQLAHRLQEWDPKHRQLGILFSRAIYVSQEFSDQEKISRLIGFKSNSIWRSYYLACLYANQLRFQEASLFLRANADCIDRLIGETGDQLEVVAADGVYFCEKSASKKEDCLKWLLEVQSHLILRNWNEDAFRKRKDFDERYFKSRK